MCGLQFYFASSVLITVQSSLFFPKRQCCHRNKTSGAPSEQNSTLKGIQLLLPKAGLPYYFFASQERRNISCYTYTLLLLLQSPSLVVWNSFQLFQQLYIEKVNSVQLCRFGPKEGGGLAPWRPHKTISLSKMCLFFVRHLSNSPWNSFLVLWQFLFQSTSARLKSVTLEWKCLATSLL